MLANAHNPILRWPSLPHRPNLPAERAPFALSDLVFEACSEKDPSNGKETAETKPSAQDPWVLYNVDVNVSEPIDVGPHLEPVGSRSMLDPLDSFIEPETHHCTQQRKPPSFQTQGGKPNRREKLTRTPPR